MAGVRLKRLHLALKIAFAQTLQNGTGLRPSKYGSVSSIEPFCVLRKRNRVRLGAAETPG
jgi:hypothetical protein